MQIRNRHLLLAFGAVLALSAAGCREESPGEKMGEAIEDAAEDIGDAAEDAAEDIGEAAEDAKEEAEEAFE